MEGGVIINGSCRGKIKFQKTGSPLSFLREGVHSNKQITNVIFVFQATMLTQKCNVRVMSVWHHLTLQLIKNNLDLLKLIEVWPDRFKIVKILSKHVQTYPALSKLVETCPNLWKLVQSCSNLSKLVRICPICDFSFSGYYADQEMQCQGYHVCLTPPNAATDRKTSFICPNGTIFNQQLLICDWW